MEEELISKKDLLDEASISYGQLYRWKRKDLIPEDWFVRKSTYTGQETFFPRVKILDRINKIKQMKSDVSLDELAEMFSPNAKQITLTKDELIKRNIVTESIITLYSEHISNKNTFDFEAILQLYLVNNLLHEGHILLEEARMIFHTLHEHYSKTDQTNAKLLVVRKMGVAFVLLLGSSHDVFVDTHAKVIVEQQMGAVIEELNNKLVMGG
ncbi:YhbD family protein [Bacillus tianshenii]|uniref:YhbD family protein n=1 Tax=Sutcliffiella tianshenii TaxID=1463404 RepID=UPI001CD72ED8|nr:YhbD family protein [Bacillus tianshenii]MCA1322391.1 YhbD family protein [Bacillus tianshenii]